MSKEEKWSWYLRAYGQLVQSQGGFPTEEAARKAAESVVNVRGGANWRSNPDISVRITREDLRLSRKVRQPVKTLLTV